MGRKEGRVFLILDVSISPYAELGPNEYREDARHFIPTCELTETFGDNSMRELLQIAHVSFCTSHVHAKLYSNVFIWKISSSSSNLSRSSSFFMIIKLLFENFREKFLRKIYKNFIIFSFGISSNSSSNFCFFDFFFGFGLSGSTSFFISSSTFSTGFSISTGLKFLSTIFSC